MILKQYLKYLSLSIIFYLILGFVFFIYLLCIDGLELLNTNNFLRFDALLYEDIKNNGYVENWLCAFFPAFPYLWKTFNVNAITISFINLTIFLLSSGALAQLYKIDWKQHFFLLSIPSLLFMFVPYTEALFFAAGTLLIIGLEKNKLIIIILGLLLGSLIRPTTFIFIPAILGTYILATNNLKQGLMKSILPILALIFGLFITISIHYYFTKKWFIFFEAQKLWKNYLHLPQLPLTSWGGDGSVRYDGSALMIAVFCAAYLIFALIRRIKKVELSSKSIAFSALYIFGTSLLILAYRDGNLYSLNRFIYATPFIFVTAQYFFLVYQFKWKHVWFLIIVTELFWLLFNSYNHVHNLLMFSTVTLYFVILLFSKHNNKTISLISFICLTMINCIGFVKLFARYLNDTWVG